MNKKVKVIRVFIASPSDVIQERDRSEIVVSEINRDIGDSLGVRLEAIRWETYVSPSMGRPEDVVLKQVDVNQWDIFIGIIWSRFGSPTGGYDTHNGLDFNSGTEEEFSIAYKSWKSTGFPQILFYRCIRPPKKITDIVGEQYKNVENFFNEFYHDKKHPGIVSQYEEIDDFERKLRGDLTKVVREIMKGYVNQSTPELNVDHRLHGFKNLFLPNKNEDRNISKKNAIKNAIDMKLIAHSGHSFFSLVGHKYRKELTNRLKEGATFKAILTNPWSYTALLIALTSKEQKGTLHDNYISILKGDLDPVKIINESSWYKIKFSDSIKGYLKLIDEYGENIQVKFTHHDLPSTIFLTESYCTFEPYLNINLDNRATEGMITFEIQTNETSHLYQNSLNYFDFLWDTSIFYDDFISDQEKYKSILTSNIS